MSDSICCVVPISILKSSDMSDGEDFVSRCIQDIKSSAFYAIIVVLLVHVLHLFCSRGLRNMWDRAIPIKNEDAFTLVPPEPALFIAAFISLHFYPYRNEAA